MGPLRTRAGRMRRASAIWMVLALAAVFLFFSFFGNGASSDPSLYRWIVLSYGDYAVETLLILAGLAVYLIANKKFRQRVALGRVRPEVGAAWITSASAVAAAAFIGGAPAFSMLALIALVFAVLFSFYGRGASIYPLILLLGLFALPVSPVELLGPVLQHAVSVMTRPVLAWLDTGFAGHGATMSFSGFEFRIAEECSGVRSIELGLKFTLLILILYPTRWRFRLSILGLSVLVGMVSNLLRIAVVIGFGAWRGAEFAMETGHETVGPLAGLAVLLGYLILLVFYCGKRISKTKRSCCERRMARFVPRLAGCTIVSAGAAALLCLVLGSRGDLRPAGSVEKWVETGDAGDWIRVPALFCRSAVCVWSSSSALGGGGHTHCRCGSAWEPLAFYSYLEDEEAGTDVFRAIYRHRRTGREVSLVVIRGGRPGQTLCWPRWHLRSMGASVGMARREVLSVAGSNVPVSRFEFSKNNVDPGAGSYDAMLWYVSGRTIHSRRLRLASFFEPFDQGQWAGMVYAEKDLLDDGELPDLVRQVIKGAVFVNSD